MRISLRVFGLDLLDVEITTTDDAGSPSQESDLSGGTTSSYPIGFTPSPGDQRWERGVELQ